jgi:hypothetical protein
MDTTDFTEVSTSTDHIPMKSITKRRASSILSGTSSDESLISIHEPNSPKHWELPPICPQDVYKLKWWNYLSHSFIKVHSIDIPFSTNEDPVNITLTDKDLID